jgi:hypothetical protein
MADVARAQNAVFGPDDQSVDQGRALARAPRATCASPVEKGVFRDDLRELVRADTGSTPPVGDLVFALPPGPQPGPLGLAGEARALARAAGRGDFTLLTDEFGPLGGQTALNYGGGWLAQKIAPRRPSPSSG